MIFVLPGRGCTKRSSGLLLDDELGVGEKRLKPEQGESTHLISVEPKEAASVKLEKPSICSSYFKNRSGVRPRCNNFFNFYIYTFLSVLFFSFFNWVVCLR